MQKKKTVTPKAGQRQLRIAEEIRHVLAGIIADNNLADPDLAGRMVTVTVVKISPDLRNATIFMAPFGGVHEPGDAEKVVRALNRAAGYFRGELARQVEMRVSPQLRFKIDDSFDEASRIEALLHDPVVRADLAKAREEAREEAKAAKLKDAEPKTVIPGDEFQRMSRRKKGQKVDGWVILDKPLGITSTQAVAVVRRIFDAQKAGHGGTLDPLASGILPIALGEATKTVPYVMDGAKAYRFTLKFGEQRTTDDAEGEVIARSDIRPDAAAIEAALPTFIGLIDQVPPQFSAIKVDGERAYDLAREGEIVELASRKIRVDDFRLVEFLNADEAVFEVKSGKGAYMRSLARDLAQHLGSVGHISALRRLSVGGFTEERAISLDALKSLGHIPAAFEHLLPIETALDDIPALALSATEAIRLRSGQPVGLLHRQDRDRLREFTPGGMVCAMSEGKIVALTRYEGGELVPVRVINH